jgi:hypothetical protein
MDSFDRIMAIFEELSNTKTASLKNPKPGLESSVSEYKPGTHDSETSSLLSDMYSYVPDVGEHGPRIRATSSPATTDVAFPGEGEDYVSKTIERKDIDPKQFIRKVASVSDSELVTMFTNIASKTLKLLDSGTITQQSTPSQQQQQILTWEPKIEKSAASDIINENVSPDALIGVAWGTLYSFQKQAEEDADLVGSYIHSFLKSAMDSALEQEIDETFANVGATEEERESEEQESSTEEPEEEAPKRKEEEKEEQEKKQKKITDTREDRESTTSDQLSEEEATRIIDEMTGENAELREKPEQTKQESSDTELTDEELLQSISQALVELGITPEELKETGDVGEKLASLVTDFRRSGKFRLDKISHKKRAAIDRCKHYITELMTKRN